jgi:hypothetical protein
MRRGPDEMRLSQGDTKRGRAAAPLFVPRVDPGGRVWEPFHAGRPPAQGANYPRPVRRS